MTETNEIHIKGMDNNALHRSLRARHLTMISIGGSIGTGVFLASGASIAAAGPGGALAAYALMGVMVYFVMTSLCEMATFLPVSGSMSAYASRFVDPAFGFALGWNYWYSWSITIAVEISAAAVAMSYWAPHVPGVWWSAIFLVLLLGLNLLSVRGYGESEFWFALVKVVTIILFIVVGLLMIVGIVGGKQVGLRNLTIGDAPFHGGWLAAFGVLMIAGFSFQGTELVGVAAGETDDPRTNVPRAIRQVFWRILLFYVLAIFVIGALIPYNSPQLLGSGDVGAVTLSPFTLVFHKAGFALSAAVMNAVILTAVLSAGNSGLYASSRMLWGMAAEGSAPRFLAKVNRRGIPHRAVLVTALVGSFAFLSTLFGQGVVFTWLLNASGLSGFLVWFGLALSHYRFRRAYVAQGKDPDKLPYRARWFPFGPLLALTMCTVVILGQNYSAFTGGRINWNGIIVSYIGLPLFILLWAGYKTIRKTKVVPLRECRFDPHEPVA